MNASLEAEKNVLGAIMEHNCFECAAPLDPDDFYSADHQVIFSTIQKIGKSDGNVNVVAVAESLTQDSQIEKASGYSYLAALVDNAPGMANLEAYVSIVKQRSRLRKFQKVCKEAVNRCENQQGKDVDTLISETLSSIDRIVAANPGNERTWLDVLIEADFAIEEAVKLHRAGKSIGLPTGLLSLDDRIGGYQPGRLIILAGRPSLGKTAFALQSILHAAKLGHCIGMFSLEMNAGELGIRAYANMLEVNGTALAFGNGSVVEAYTKKLHGTDITKLKIFIDDSTYTLPGIISKAHEWRHKHRIEMLVVDHIGLIESEAESANARLGEITRTLKKISKRLQIPVLALCQLNRNVEKEKRRPKLSDLRDSGNIEQDADIAIFLHSEEDDGTDTETRIEIGVLKTRYGRKGWLPQEIRFDGQVQKFKEIYRHAA